MSETKTVGRKPILTLAEKKDIVNRYLIANGQDPSVLQQHGVYENLAHFARTLNETYNSKVRSYHFYDAEIKAYISMLVNDLSATDEVNQIGCAYIPIDLDRINQLARSHRYTEMIQVLREREGYISDLYHKVAKAAAYNEFISSKFALKAQEFQVQEEKLAALEAEVNRLASEIKSKNAEINKLINEKRSLVNTLREKEDEMAVIMHNKTLSGLGINNNLQSLIKRENNRSAQEKPEQDGSSGCKIINLLPDLEE